MAAKTKERYNDALNSVFRVIGVSELAEKLDISKQAVSCWNRVPEKRVNLVSKITGIPVDELRPDIFMDK